MIDKLQSLALTLILAILCGTLGWLVKTNKQRILEYTSQLIQKAENAVQGSGMGEAKKKLVVAQLEAAGIRVTSWLSSQIDAIVGTLNSRGAWLAEQTQEVISGLVSNSDTAGSETNGNS